MTPWTVARQASLSITNSWSLLKLMSIKSRMMPSNHLIFCRPLLLLTLIFPSIKVFSNELALHIRWPKHWSFSFSTSPSNEYSGLIFFKIDWFDLFAVQGILKSRLQHRSSKASQPKYIFYIWLLDKESFLFLKNWTFRTKSSFLAYITFCKPQYSFIPLLINEVVGQIL